MCPPYLLGELDCIIWACAQLALMGSLSQAFTALLYLIPNGLLRGLKAEACLSPEADSHHVSTFPPQTVSYACCVFRPRRVAASLGDDRRGLQQ